MGDKGIKGAKGDKGEDAINGAKPTTFVKGSLFIDNSWNFRVNLATKYYNEPIMQQQFPTDDDFYHIR